MKLPQLLRINLAALTIGGAYCYTHFNMQVHTHQEEN